MSPPSEHAKTRIGELHALVLGLFTAEEFRRWLRSGPDADIVPELPSESVADAAIVDKALGALERRGRIDAAFFARMTSERERMRDMIAAVAALWRDRDRAEGGSFRALSHSAVEDLMPRSGSSASPARNDLFLRGPLATRPDLVAAASASQEIVLASWIHVSDLHFGHGDTSHQWNQQRVLNELLVDAQTLVHDGMVAPPDFAFVTGDIAFSGGARKPAAGEAEYTLASHWLGHLQTVLEIPRERTFMVPGNHDVDRRAEVDVRRLLKLARAGDEPLDDLLRAPVDLARLRDRMDKYLAFARNFGPPASDRFHDGLWWRHYVNLDRGVSLRVCGLNTTLLSLDDQDQGKLRVGQRQLVELFLPMPGKREIVMVLSHHPATGHWLADEKELRGQLDRHAAIHLFGHLHEADSEHVRHGSGTGCLRITAGAAHGEAVQDGSPPVGHGYNFGALVVLGSGDLAVRIWPRRWSTRAPRFVTDVDNTIDGRNHAEHRLPDTYRIHRPLRTPRLSHGDVLGDRYQLDVAIGRGGIGQVWRAFDLESNEMVAVKILNPEGMEPDPARRAHFFRGAQVMAGLEHPAIARVRDPRPDPENRHGPYDFYVMDFINAPNLGTAFKGAPRSDAETIGLLLAIGEGVAAAHKKGVIHRDLKPSNILCDPASGRVHIIDFDTAKDLNNPTMTRSGKGFASPYYASPEVAAGLDNPVAPRPDERADIFSLAMIGVFLRTGGHPHFFSMDKVFLELKCAPELRQVLAKGCAHSVEERYTSMENLLSVLRRLLVDGSHAANSGSPPREQTSAASDDGVPPGAQNHHLAKGDSPHAPGSSGRPTREMSDYGVPPGAQNHHLAKSDSSHTPGSSGRPTREHTSTFDDGVPPKAQNHHPTTDDSSHAPESSGRPTREDTSASDDGVPPDAQNHHPATDDSSHAPGSSGRPTREHSSASGDGVPPGAQNHHPATDDSSHAPGSSGRPTREHSSASGDGVPPGAQNHHPATDDSSHALGSSGRPTREHNSASGDGVPPGVQNHHPAMDDSSHAPGSSGRPTSSASDDGVPPGAQNHHPAMDDSSHAPGSSGRPTREHSSASDDKVPPGVQNHHPATDDSSHTPRSSGWPLHSPSDLELLTLWEQGESRVGNELVRRFQRELTNFFRRKVPDSHDVQDLVQETFVAFLLSGRSRSVQGSVRSYVFGIARHTLSRYYRSSSGKIRLNLDPDDAEVLALPDLSEIWTPLQDRREELFFARTALSPEVQLLLEAFYIDGLTAQECATKFEVPVTTIWGRLRLAKATLTRVLTADDTKKPTR